METMYHTHVQETIPIQAIAIEKKPKKPKTTSPTTKRKQVFKSQNTISGTVRKVVLIAPPTSIAEWSATNANWHSVMSAGESYLEARGANAVEELYQFCVQQQQQNPSQQMKISIIFAPSTISGQTTPEQLLSD